MPDIRDRQSPGKGRGQAGREITYLLTLTHILLRIYLLFAIPSIAVGHALGKASLIWITCILIVMLVVVPQVRKKLAKQGRG